MPSLYCFVCLLVLFTNQKYLLAILLLKNQVQPGMVSITFILSIQEACNWVWGQLGLQGKFWASQGYIIRAWFKNKQMDKQNQTKSTVKCLHSTYWVWSLSQKKKKNQPKSNQSFSSRKSKHLILSIVNQRMFSFKE